MSSQSQGQLNTIAQDPNDFMLTGKISAALMIDRAANHIASMEYNQRKASKLLKALYELLIAEAQFESELVDIGFAGCQE